MADLERDEESREVRRAGEEIQLTPTGFELLRYLMRNERVVLSKAQILEPVWKYDFQGRSNIVELYVGAANVYYKYERFAALGVVALYLLLARVEWYPWFRWVLVLTTGLALAGHLAYPLMPPRMRPDFGLVDTGVTLGQSVYGPDRANSYVMKGPFIRNGAGQVVGW